MGLPIAEMGLLKADEVAHLLRVKTARVYDMSRRGLLPTVLLGERTLRFDEQALRQWIARGGSDEKTIGDRE